MTVGAFVFINFCVSFIADIVLNDLSSSVSYFSSLKPYFKNKFIVEAAGYAGITVAVATLILTYLSYVMFGFYMPVCPVSGIKFFTLAYVLGYIIDKLIEYTNIFGKSLKPFYDDIGSGHSGAIAFVVSLIISLIIQKYLIPILYGKENIVIGKKN